MTVSASTTRQSELRPTLLRAAVAAVCAVAAAPAVEAQWRESYPVIRIGIVAGPDAALTRSRVEPFRAYLDESLEVSVEVLTAPDYGSLIAEQFTGRLHATFLSASAFAGASAACGGCVEPLVAQTTPSGEAGYRAALIVSSENALSDPANLAGTRLAVSAEDSLAGRMLPLALFVEAGVDFADVEIVERGSQAAAVLAVVSGGAEAGLGWIGLSDDAADRGVLADLAAAGRLLLGEVRVAWTSPTIPHGPLTVLDNLPDDLKSELAAAMLALAEADPDALVAIDANLGGGFADVDAGDYEPLMLLTDPDLELPR